MTSDRPQPHYSAETEKAILDRVARVAERLLTVFALKKVRS